MGYPPLVTPFSQYVKNLSMMNVMAMEKGKERWGMIADDIWDMLLGKAGKLPGELAPELVEKAEREGRKFFNGNPQDNYPDALDKYRKLMKENKWELGEDDEELFEYAMHPQVDIFILYRFIQFAEHVNGVLSQHTGQLDIQTAFTDSQRHLFRFQEDFRLVLFLVQTDRRDFGRAEGALYKQLDIRRIVDNIDILVAKLADNTMNTATLHTDAGAYRVDTVIV